MRAMRILFLLLTSALMVNCGGGSDEGSGGGGSVDPTTIELCGLTLSNSGGFWIAGSDVLSRGFAYFDADQGLRDGTTSGQYLNGSEVYAFNDDLTLSEDCYFRITESEQNVQWLNDANQWETLSLGDSRD